MKKSIFQIMPMTNKKGKTVYYLNLNGRTLKRPFKFYSQAVMRGIKG